MNLDILHQKLRSILKTIKTLPPLLSLWHLYIWNPVFLSIIFFGLYLGNVNLTVGGETEPILERAGRKQKTRNFASLLLDVDIDIGIDI